MKRILRALLGTFMLTSTPTWAAINQIDSFEQITSLLHTLEPSSLVVFDVDAVLIEHEDAILQPPNKPLLQSLIAKHANTLAPDHFEDLVSVIYLETKAPLIEESVVPLIATLQEKNIPVIGLTATRIGKIGRVDSIQDWRIQALDAHGISFTKFPSKNLTTVTGQGPSPVFKEGIAFSSTYPKGKVLQAVLESLDMIPETVVFIDDLYQNSVSVESHMKQLGVKQVHCFQYVGAKKVYKQANSELAQTQIRHLVTHKTWLSEEKAQEMINSIQ